MPTDRQRLQTLVRAGLLPETAQDIIEDGATLIEVAPEAAARITPRDRSRARTFVLFSDLFPDWLRGMLDAVTVEELETQ